MIYPRTLMILVRRSNIDAFVQGSLDRGKRCNDIMARSAQTGVVRPLLYGLFCRRERASGDNKSSPTWADRLNPDERFEMTEVFTVAARQATCDISQNLGRVTGCP